MPARTLLILNQQHAFYHFSGECNISRRWREYLGKELETEEREVGGQRLEEFGESSQQGEEGQGRRCEETVYHCPLVIVLLSKKMVAWLERTKIVLGKLLHPDRVVGVYVDLSLEQVTPTVANCLQTLPCWRMVLIGQQDTDQDESDFLIGQYTQEILTNQKRLSECPYQAKYQLFPRKLSLSQTKVMIILDEGVDSFDR